MAHSGDFQVKYVAESFALESTYPKSLGILPVFIVLTGQENEPAVSFAEQQHSRIGHEGGGVIFSPGDRHILVEIDPANAKRPSKYIRISDSEHAGHPRPAGKAADVNPLAIHPVAPTEVASRIQRQAKSIQWMTPVSRTARAHEQQFAVLQFLLPILRNDWIITRTDPDQETPGAVGRISPRNNDPEKFVRDIVGGQF